MQVIEHKDTVISSCCGAIVYEGDICSSCLKKCEVKKAPVTHSLLPLDAFMPELAKHNLIKLQLKEEVK